MYATEQEQTRIFGVGVCAHRRALTGEAWNATKKDRRRTLRTTSVEMSQAPRSFENLARIDENRFQNDEKSRKNRRRALWGARGRSADAGGSVQERFGRRPGRPKSGLGTAQATSGRSKSASGAARGASAAHPDDARTRPKSVPEAKACANGRRIEFSALQARRADAPMWENRNSCQCFVHFGRSQHRTPPRSEK